MSFFNKFLIYFFDVETRDEEKSEDVQDCFDIMNLVYIFIFESYKIAMASFTILFLKDIISTIYYNTLLTSNIITMISFIICYLFEFYRESWMINECMNDPKLPANNLDTLCNTTILHDPTNVYYPKAIKLIRFNRIYRILTYLVVLINIVNFILSIVIWFIHRGSDSTETIIITILTNELFISTKLHTSLSNVFTCMEFQYCIAKSCYLIKFQNFNAFETVETKGHSNSTTTSSSTFNRRRLSGASPPRKQIARKKEDLINPVNI